MDKKEDKRGKDDKPVWDMSNIEAELAALDAMDRKEEKNRKENTSDKNTDHPGPKKNRKPGH